MENTIEKLTLKKAVRAYCFDCQHANIRYTDASEVPYEVEHWDCQNEDCRLYLYAFGKNPRRKRKYNGQYVD